MAVTNTKLSAIQVHLLRFFNERVVTDQETQELQRLIAHYYAQKADTLMEKIWVDKGYNEEKMRDLLEQDLNQ